MFTTFAKTFFRASGLPSSHKTYIPHSWYREDLRDQPAAKRWEDWR